MFRHLLSFRVLSYDSYDAIQQWKRKIHQKKIFHKVINFDSLTQIKIDQYAFKSLPEKFPFHHFLLLLLILFAPKEQKKLYFQRRFAHQHHHHHLFSLSSTIYTLFFLLLLAICL